jgi:hypothetical protein
MAEITKLPNNLEQQNHLSTARRRREKRDIQTPKSLHVNPVDAA